MRKIYGFSEINESNQNEIMIVKTGKWKHPVYGEFRVNSKSLNEFKNNFDNKTRGVDIGIDVEHDSYNGYVGWFKEVFIRGNALIGVIEWTAEGAKMIKEKTFRYFSPELAFEYEDMETQEKFTNVLIGGGITNRPYFKGLKPLLASESNASEGEQFDLYFNAETMDDNKEVVEEVEEKAEEKAEETTEETTETVEETKEESKEEVVEESTEEPKEEAKEETTEEVAEVKASESMTLSEENAMLKKQIRASEIDAKVSDVVCSEGNTDKLFLPKAKDAVTEFFNELSDEQIAKFNEITKLTVKAGMFNELGSDKAETSLEEPSKTLNFNLAKEAGELAAKEGIGFEKALFKLNEKYKSIRD